MVSALARASLLLWGVATVATAQKSLSELLHQENSRGNEYPLGFLEPSVVLIVHSEQRRLRALPLSSSSVWTEQQLAALLADTTFLPRTSLSLAPPVVIGTLTTGNRSAELALRRWDGSRWSIPEPLLGVNSPGWDGQPALSPDGQWLVFASDRIGGWGGLDLYICRRLPNGGWSSPQNLGPSVNTAADEALPWFLPDGRLLFAARGSTSSARWKLVVAHRSAEGTWEREAVLPPPLNSDDDDFAPVVIGDTLVLASNRTGGRGGYDLYAFPLCGPVVVAVSFPQRFPGELSVHNGDTLLASFPVLTDTSISTRAFRHLRFRYALPCSAPIELTLNTPCDFVRTVFYRLALPAPTPLSEQRCLSLTSFQAPTAEHAWSRALLESFRLRAIPLSPSPLPLWETPEVRTTEALIDSLVHALFHWLERRECASRLKVELLVSEVLLSHEELARKASEAVLSGAPLSPAERRSVVVADLLTQLRSRLPAAPEVQWRIVPAPEQSPDTLCIRLRLRME